VFSFTFGLIGAEAVAECKAAGIRVMGTATTLDEGLALQKLGVDAVVAQGLEAGGHRGQFEAEKAEPGRAPADEGTLALTRRLVAALTLPVAASGGLMDGRDIAAALAAGAQAAHLGTAFLLCDEAGTSAPYRAALAAAKTDTTRFTRAFSGRWARGLDNRFMRELDGRGDAVLPFPAQNAFTRDIRKAAAAQGRAEFLSLWAGKGVARSRALPAGKLVELLRAETAAALEAAA
jgi:nitronate monooxygenase